MVAAGTESHCGIGKEFNNYLMESKEYLKRNHYILITEDPCFGDALI